MDKKHLRLLLTAAILLLAILLGLEIAASRRAAQAPRETTAAVSDATLPPNMLPFG